MARGPTGGEDHAFSHLLPYAPGGRTVSHRLARPVLMNSGWLHYAFWTSVTDFESCALRALVAEEVESACGLWSLEIVNLRGHLLDVEPASHRRYFPNLVWTPTSCPPIGGISVSDQGWISCRRNGDIVCGAPPEAR
jgi:hypothetical protein